MVMQWLSKWIKGRERTPTAAFISEQGSPPGAIQRLYRLSVPMKNYKDESFDYVMMSGVYVPCSGPETYIFGADAEGNVLHWGELDGSFRGDIDHARALRGAGYAVIDKED